MRRATLWLGASLFAGALVLSMAPVGGFPSRPFLRSLGVGVAAPATDGVAAINSKAVVGSNAFRSTEIFRVKPDANSGLEVGASGGDIYLRAHDGTFFDDLVLDGNNLEWKEQGGTAVSLEPSSGSFTLEFNTQCTQANLPFTVQWYKIGSIISLQIPPIIGCTSDTTSFAASGTPVPAAIRPVLSLVTSDYFSVVNNSVAGFAGLATITSAGAFQLEKCGVTATQLGTCANTWTNTGGKSAPNPISMTYLAQ